MEERELIRRCLQGDKRSLEELVGSVQGLVFNLAVRFLWNRMDAEDATQEIVLRIVQNLRTYEGRSKFSTWAYRIAKNYLIDLDRTRIEQVLVSFDVHANDLRQFTAPVEYDLPDKELLEREVKTSCTLAMLQCLSREQRLTFILGAILKIRSNEGSEITGTTPENFRKRLEQARRLLGGHVKSHCGVYDPANACRCAKRINTALHCGRIDRNKLNFTDRIDGYNLEMEELCSLAGIYQNHGSLKSSPDMLAKIQDLISSKGIMRDG